MRRYSKKPNIYLEFAPNLYQCTCLHVAVTLECCMHKAVSACRRALALTRIKSLQSFCRIAGFGLRLQLVGLLVLIDRTSFL